MSFRADIITLYPELFPGPLGASVLGRGLDHELWALKAHQLRDYAHDKHRSVDDTPSGGGPGMVLRADILANAIDDISPDDDPRERILLSPRGELFNQSMAREFSNSPGLVLVCGRFEGVDQRVIEAKNLREISIGDYVLAGGETAAMVMLEAVVRLIPGVLGSEQSDQEESHENGLLEYPHYTRPAEFEGRPVPDVLTSGDHAKVKKWRQVQSEELTRARRPDLWASHKNNQR